MSRKLAVLLIFLALFSCASDPARHRAVAVPDDAALADLQQRTFRFFWDTADPGTHLVPDRWPTPSFSSIAAVGFGLTAYGIGAERGWVTREEAAARDAGDAAVLSECTDGSRRHRHDRIQGLLLPLPRHADGHPLQGRRAVDDRHDAAAGRRAFLRVVFRP